MALIGVESLENDDDEYVITHTGHGYPYEFMVYKNGQAVAYDTYRFRALMALDISLSTGIIQHYHEGDIVPNFLVNLRSEIECERTVAIESRK